MSWARRRQLCAGHERGCSRLAIGSLHCIAFVPREKGDLAELVCRVKDAMRALGGQLRPTGNEGPEMIEQGTMTRAARVSNTGCSARRGGKELNYGE